MFSFRDVSVKPFANALWQWAVIQVGFFWIALAGALLPLAAWFVRGIGADEFRVQVAGAIVSWLGVGLLLWGISGTSRAFGRPSIATRIKAWWSRRPRLREQHVTGAVASVSGAGSVAAVGTVTARVIGRALEARVQALEVEQRRTTQRMNEMQQRIETEFNAIRALLSTETRERMESVESVRRFVESITAGGLDWAVVGAVWAAVGVLYSTFPRQIAELLAKVW